MPKKRADGDSARWSVRLQAHTRAKARKQLKACRQEKGAAMEQDRVIQFEHKQSLAWGDGTGRWSESYQASVTITDAILTSGWYTKHFSGRGGDSEFVLLQMIGLHARPLKGDDLVQLIGLGMATPEDEGRLYARVTDVGLADEMGTHRTTIAERAQRLADKGFIRIAEIPGAQQSNGRGVFGFFRDSHGQFNGTKVYILSGDLQNLLSKQVATRPFLTDKSHRGGLSDTVNGKIAYHDALTDTVNGQKAPTVSVKPTRYVGLADTNRGVEEGGVFKSRKEIFATVFSCFAEQRDNGPYEPSNRDYKAVKTLLAQGYTPQEIMDGIRRSARRTDGTPIREARWFTFCLPEIQLLPPQARPGLFAAPPAPDEPAPAAAPAADTPAPADADHPAGDTPPQDDAAASTAHALPALVQETFTLAFGRIPTAAECANLTWFSADLARQFPGSQPWDVITAAIQASAGSPVRSPAAYIRKVALGQLQRPASQGKTQPAQKGGGGEGAKNAAALADKTLALVSQPDGSQAIVVGGVKIEKPPTRKGYVIPNDISRQSLWQVAQEMFAANGKEE